MESFDKTREKYGIRAKLTRWRFLGAASAASIMVISFFFGLNLLLKYTPFDWPDTIFSYLLSENPLLLPLTFFALLALFALKRNLANAVVDRGVYLYRLIIFPINVLVFPAFRSETGIEAKLRRTGAKRQRVERKQAARRHRESLKDKD